MTSERSVVPLLAGLAVLSLPALVDAGAVTAASGLHELGRGASPYWQPGHAVLLWLRAPLAAVSASVLFLAPGLLLVTALGFRRTAGAWILSGFAASLAMLSLVTGVLQAVLGVTMVGGRFAAVVVACAAPGAVFLVVRARRGDTVPPAHGIPDPWAVAVLLLPPVLLVAALAPKFFWESFNGDGAHAFEATRLLLTRAVPFFPAEAGPVAGFPGLTSMLFAFPGSWYMRLFGPVDAAARLPFVLHLVLLVACLAECLPDEARRRAPFGMLWFSLAGFTLAMAFSATYNPYHADLALPAPQDTLLVVAFLGFALAFERGSPGSVAGWVALTWLSLPSGVILLGTWVVAVVLVRRPAPWRMIGATVLAIAGCAVGSAVLARLLPLAGLPAPGGEYGVAGLLRYFAFLQVTDWRRVLYVAAPGGMLPLLATLAWRRQDHLSRVLTLVSWGYFAFFYVQAHVSLHHFVPSMLLPLVVFWRTLPTLAPVPGRALALAAGAAGIWLSAPSSWAPHLEGRDVGAALAVRIEGYRESSPAVFRATSLLSSLFPPDWDPGVPSRTYGGSPLTWNRYARHDGVLAPEVNYLLAAAGAAPPPGWSVAARDDGGELLVRDEAVLSRHRALRPDTLVGAPRLRVPRWVLFRTVPAQGGPAVLDVAAALGRAGIDVESLLRRLGIRAR